MKMIKNLAAAALLAVAGTMSFADGFIMPVSIEDDGVKISLVIDAESERPIMEFERFVEINVENYPWLADADLNTELPKGASFNIEL